MPMTVTVTVEMEPWCRTMLRLEMGRGVQRRIAGDLLPIAARCFTPNEVPAMRNRIFWVTVDNVPRTFAATNLSELVRNHNTVILAHNTPPPMVFNTYSGLGADLVRPNSASAPTNEDHALIPSNNTPWSANMAQHHNNISTNTIHQVGPTSTTMPAVLVAATKARCQSSPSIHIIPIMRSLDPRNQRCTTTAELMMMQNQMMIQNQMMMQN